MRILDIGCWDGKRVKDLQDKGHDAYGVDITDKHFIKGIKGLIVSDMRFTGFENKFDVIYMTDVIEHIDMDFQTMLNVYNSLKQGGELILTTPARIPLLDFYDPAWIKWKLLKKERHYHYSWEELKELLSDFKIIQAKKTGSLFWLFARWYNGFAKILNLPLLQVKRNNGIFNWEVRAVRKCK